MENYEICPDCGAKACTVDSDYNVDSGEHWYYECHSCGYRYEEFSPALMGLF